MGDAGGAGRRSGGLDERALLEVAHLWCSWRAARGATHALNNALTASAGLIEMAGAPLELEAELGRCVRITRRLTDHHPLRFDRSREADLVAVVRRAAALLRETTSRRFELAVELPDDFLVVEEDPARLELLVLTLAWRLADASGRGGLLRLAVVRDAKPGAAAVDLELFASDLSPESADRLLDPGCTSAGEALALQALERIAAGCGGALEARPLPGGLRARALLPLAEDELEETGGSGEGGALGG